MGQIFTEAQREAISQVVYEMVGCGDAGLRRWIDRIEAAAAGALPQADQPRVRVSAETLDMLAERIAEAAFCLRNLPGGVGPARDRSWWPEVVQDAFEAYNAADPRRARVTLYAEQIARMEKALRWMRWLDQPASRVVWLRAEGFTWRSISERDGRSEPTLRKAYRDALAAIAIRLSQAVVEKSSSDTK